MRRIGLALLLALSGLATPLRAQDPVTVFVVRHAEKGPENPDPSLTREGVARATALATTLADAGITTILVSQFKRTQETAAPLAERLEVTAERMDAARVDDLVARLEALPAGTHALVVSHSNLIPAILTKLTGVAGAEISEAVYDGLYIATLVPGGGGSVLRLHYGKPSPVGAGGPMR